MKRLSASILAACLLLSAAPAFAQTPVAADTASKTPAGVAYTIPKDFAEATRGTLSVVTAPENNLTITIVDAGKAASADAAVAAAWPLLVPSFNRKLQLSNAAPPRGGWDERKVYSYETSPDEHKVVQALALRRGSLWTVVLIDADIATAEKRAAALGTLIESIRPATYQRESFAGRKAHVLDAARIAQLKSFLSTSMQQLQIPGVSVALIQNGKVVYEGGIGVKKLGEPAPVDANTLFMIASNTKGMTTLLLSRLADEGKMSWDQHVTQVYPSFRLGSDATTANVTMRNLVCACTGLPRKDLEWIFNSTPSTPVTNTFVQLANTEPTSGFGEVFQYNNLIASAAGYIGGHLAFPDMDLGAAYDKAMQTMIFDPLGMTRSTFDMSKALASNHAEPHGFDIDGNAVVLPMKFNYLVVPYRPAGGEWSSAHDMTKYVLNELDLGVLPNGKRFVSQKNLLARRARGVSIGENEWYGMGLMEDARYGVSVIHHGGDLFGYHSDWYAIPSAGVGAVLLTNSDNGPILRGSFERRLLEVLYDGKPEAAADIATAAANFKKAVAVGRQQLTVPADPSAAAALATHYSNPDLGQISVSRAANGLMFDFGFWNSAMASKKNADGTMSFFTLEPALSGAEFVAGIANGKRTLTTRDGQHTYTYVESSAP